MGGYSPLPDVTDSDVERILEMVHRPLLAELARRGSPFVGALFAGLMLTPDGPVLLECNARFGDPETQIAVPRVAAAIGPLLLACARGNLSGAARKLGLDGPLLPTTRHATVAIVLASPGYPDRPRTGQRIDGLEAATRLGALVFHAGTQASNEGYVARGGRVMTIVGRGSHLAAARSAAEAAAEVVTFDGAVRRHDIALELPAFADADAEAVALAAARPRTEAIA